MAKCHARIEAFGCIDELNAALGVARTTQLEEPCDKLLASIQNQLFDLGAELATPDVATMGTDYLQDSDIARLEQWIDQFDANLPELSTFILPGGTSGAAWLHLCRCICRRAERLVVSLGETETVRPGALKYLNRLGDLLFVLARSVNAAAKVGDIPWQKSR